MSVSEVARKRYRKEDVKEVALQFTDLSGILHSLSVPSGLLPKVAAEGIHMDGSSVDMVDISESDLKLMPRLETFVVLPPTLFAQRVARVLCDIYQPESERPYELDPGFVLKKAPIAPDIHPRKAPREKADVLFASPALSARRALNETAKAASPRPSNIAITITRTTFVVSANPIRLTPASTFPRSSMLFLPYLSARIPSGMLVATKVPPMVKIVTPIQKSENPWTLVRKYERSV